VKTTIVVLEGKWAIQRDTYSWAACWHQKPGKKASEWEMVAWFPTLVGAAKWIGEQIRDEVPVTSFEELARRARDAEIVVNRALDGEIAVGAA